MSTVVPVMLSRRKVAIVGAGPAGLVASKQLREAGIVAKVFTSNIGGMWNAKENPFWPNMRTNLSKFTCRFSDQSWPDSTPMFPTQSQMHDYLSDYATKHLLTDNLVLQCKVTSVQRENDGKMKLVWEDSEHTATTELFDDVIITSGFFSKPILSGDFSKFKGRVLHSSEYKNPEAFAGRRVVVVGSSFSSAEIASDVATQAESVRNVVSRSSWILPHFLPVEPEKPNTPFLPVDLLFYAINAERDGMDRAEALFKTDQDRNKTNRYLQSLLGPEQEDVMRQIRQQELDSLPPDTSYTVPSVQASISNNYSNAVRAGLVDIQQGYLHSAEGDILYLSSSKHSQSVPLITLEGVDDVILCTGFTPELGYLDTAMQDAIGLSAESSLQPLLLHRDVMHPAVPGLYFVGMYRGPYFTVLELQAKAVAGYIAGTLPLPTKETQRAGVELSERIRHQTPRPQFPHADYVGLSFDWMREIGTPLPFSTETDSMATTSASAASTPTHAQIFTPNMLRTQTDLACAEVVGLEKAVQDCYAGKFMSPIIFRALLGSWAFERTLESRLDIAPSGTVVGNITLSRSDRSNPDLVYIEKGKFTTSKGLVMDVNGSQYVYSLNEAEDCIDIYFADKATGRVKERIFVSLRVVQREADGWLAVGEPHLCGEDTYRVAFKFAFQGLALRSVLISIDVAGPFKDYTSITQLLRPSSA